MKFSPHMSTACRLSACLFAGSLLLVGCASHRGGAHAPVEDKGTFSGKGQTGVITTVSPAVKMPPGFENAGKPGYYTVKPGDTLMRIGLETGQGWKDIARWNALDNPNVIEVGQTLRVIPPVAGTASASVAAAPVPVSEAGGTVVRPVSSSSSSSSSASSASTAGTTTATPAPVATSSEDDVAMLWPASGTVVATFDEVKNKGVDIAGKLGDPVNAVADGRVVYAGAGLRGYGNLIILKHNDVYLTAYAHNQTLLVKEDQSVRKGQKIAEMGNSDADRVKLHFEVRKQGKPVDPLKYLPAK
jgi:lipoprotein NlpD